MQLIYNDFLLQAFDYENNRCKDLVPHDLSSKEKKVASDILDEGELAKKTTKYMEVNPDDVRVFVVVLEKF